MRVLSFDFVLLRHDRRTLSLCTPCWQLQVTCGFLLRSYSPDRRQSLCTTWLSWYRRPCPSDHIHGLDNIMCYTAFVHFGILPSAFLFAFVSIFNQPAHVQQNLLFRMLSCRPSTLCPVIALLSSFSDGSCWQSLLTKHTCPCRVILLIISS